MSVIRWPDDDAPVAAIGGKAFALAALGRGGFDVPPWFAVTADAATAGLPAIADDVAAAVSRLVPDGGLVAVRSSAIDEDGAGHSFAGQFESYLNVPPSEVLARVREVWQSADADRVLTYRRERGLEGPPVAPAVIVQRMAVPQAAGVAFSADPVSGRRSLVVVAAVPGLGDALVSGDADADAYEVTPAGVVTLRSRREGAATPVLTDAQAAAVAALARKCEQHFGRPQDIEWALELERVLLLQSRPITTLAALADPDGTRRIWDNSNIAESYGGITTPLTFSFARTVYAEVYRQFCVILAVPRTRVEDHHVTFETMLGSIRGRVYYNLVSWYRVLALLPGFAVNRRFMEQMMGVREPMPDEVLAGEPPVTGVGRVVDALRLARSLVGLVVALVRLPGSIDRFYARLEAALGAPTPLEEMRLDALTAHYRTLERQLLTRWDAPLVNDFFAMIFYGVLRTLAGKWLGNGASGLHNDLLVGEGDIVSAEPARRLQVMARVVAVDPELTTLLAERPLAEIQAAFAASPNRAFLDLYDAYLAKFSDRCLDELKLESPTLADDPLMLLRTIGQLAQRQANVTGTVPITNEVRGGAEARVAAALRGRPIRALIFRWVMGQARARVRHRENLRFERTRVFGRVRRIFVEAGKRLAGEGLLSRPDDVFYLQVDEVLGVVEGTATTAALPALAAVRRREYDAYRALPAPADRFETRGAVWVGNRFQAAPAGGGSTVAEALGDDERRGIGCCPGVVEGVARVVRDPRGATLVPGDILVAERTDPGWILLFPVASAVVVERGSVLSHSAIVARELGLPAVVSMPGLTAWLQTGDRILVDGSTGIVRRLSRVEAAPA